MNLKITVGALLVICLGFGLGVGIAEYSNLDSKSYDDNGDSRLDVETESVVKNPWGEENITVVVENNVKDGRNYRKLSSQAIEYWNSNMSKLGYNGRFVLSNGNTENREVTIKVVENIDVCGIEQDNFIGCAEFGEKQSDGESTTVRIESGYKKDDTIETIIHELGHTLRLTHSDSDEWKIMSAKSKKLSTSLKNATNRDNPWTDNTVTVYTNLDSLDRDRRLTARKEISKAIQYYRSGGDGFTPSSVSIEVAQSRNNADIIIDISENISGGSTGVQSGLDKDGDGAIEVYTNSSVKINSDTPVDHYSWHAGYWIGKSFGIKSDDELPDAFNGDNKKERDSI